MRWVVYIVRCSDASYYTGITNALDKRIDAHNAGKGAKYTKGRAPVELFYHEEYEDRSAASRRELEIKALSKQEKEKLIERSKDYG
ncbi:MAG: GIY-YIG nuclease family protein [Alphaproteobacteria bacterium]